MRGANYQQKYKVNILSELKHYCEEPEVWRNPDRRDKWSRYDTEQLSQVYFESDYYRGTTPTDACVTDGEFYYHYNE